MDIYWGEIFLEKRTKIIATIGPASSSEEILMELIKSGVSLTRLNFSFGTHKEHQARIEKIRKISDELDLPIAIIQDLQGPKLRVQKLLDGSINLKADDKITIVDTLDVDKKTISISYPNLWQYIKKDMHLLLDDGLIELKVEAVEDGKIQCSVLHGGFLVEGKGLNIPSSGLKIPGITAKDKEDLKFGIQHHVDYVALSFVKTENDILELRQLIKESNSKTEIIAKIEKPEAIDHITKILQVSNAIMVARGDLAIEVPLERVPSLQRKLIELCQFYTKPVIIATQMLYTMEINPRPSRAEVSDVANAIQEGADAVMLSGETAIGKYPIEAVKTMAKIIVEAEKTSPRFLHEQEYTLETIHRIPSAASQAVCMMAQNLNAKAIFSFTSSGFTPLAISKQRPLTSIIALTPFKEVQRRCSLYWGVQSILVETIDTTDMMFEVSEKLAIEKGLAVPGDVIIITAGIPFGISGTTNLLKIHTIRPIKNAKLS